MWVPGWPLPARRSAAASHPVPVWVFPAAEPGSEYYSPAQAPGSPDRESEAASGSSPPAQEPAFPVSLSESEPGFPVLMSGSEPGFPLWVPASGFPGPVQKPGFPLNESESGVAFPGCFRHPAALYGQKGIPPGLPGSPPPGLPAPEPGSVWLSERAMASGSATASENLSEPESAWASVWELVSESVTGWVMRSPWHGLQSASRRRCTRRRRFPDPHRNRCSHRSCHTSGCGPPGPAETEPPAGRRL